MVHSFREVQKVQAIVIPLNARYTYTQGRKPSRRLRPSFGIPNLVLGRGRLLLVRLRLVHELPVDVSEQDMQLQGRWWRGERT